MEMERQVIKRLVEALEEVRVVLVEINETTRLDCTPQIREAYNAIEFARYYAPEVCPIRETPRRT